MNITQSFNKENIKKILVNGSVIFAGALITAISMHIFILPAAFAPGGVSGIASIIQNIFYFPASLSLLVLNAPLVVLSFIFLSRKLAIKSTITILLSSGFLQLFRMTDFFQFQEQNGYVLSALAGGILTGAGIGLLVRVGSSSGGTDIISLLIQKKKSSLSISWLIFFMNIFVIAFGGILYIFVKKMSMNDVISIMLYSFLTVFLSSKSMEIVLNGVSSAVKFEVITSKAEELGEAIFRRLNRGVTIIHSQGGYTKSDNTVLVCVVTRRQITPFRRILKEVDPAAFAFAMDTREVLGNGFKK